MRDVGRGVHQRPARSRQPPQTDRALVRRRDAAARAADGLLRIVQPGEGVGAAARGRQRLQQRLPHLSQRASGRSTSPARRPTTAWGRSWGSSTSAASTGDRRAAIHHPARRDHAARGQPLHPRAHDRRRPVDAAALPGRDDHDHAVQGGRRPVDPARLRSAGDIAAGTARRRGDGNESTILVHPLGYSDLQLQFCDRRGWGVGDQCKKANTQGRRTHWENNGQPWLPVPVLGTSRARTGRCSSTSTRRPTRSSCSRTTSRRAADGCRRGACRPGPVTVLFHAVGYHLAIDDPADASTSFQYLRNYSFMRTDRHFDDLGDVEFGGGAGLGRDEVPLRHRLGVVIRGAGCLLRCFRSQWLRSPADRSQGAADRRRSTIPIRCSPSRSARRWRRCATTIARRRPTRATASPTIRRRARFGQRLFFDKALSGPLHRRRQRRQRGRRWGGSGEAGKVSCAGCHLPDSGFVDTRSRGKQISLAAQWTTRRTPTLLEVAFAPLYNWDGRRDSIWRQAIGVMESERELNSGRLFVAQQVFALHRAEYEAIFGAMPRARRRGPLPGARARGRRLPRARDRQRRGLRLPREAGRRRRLRRHGARRSERW